MKLEELNALANEPEVLQNTAPGFADIDLSHFYNTPGNYILGNYKGAVLFAKTAPQAYEMHYLCTYACRGKKALDLARAAIDMLFTTTDVQVIHGETPEDMLFARVVNRALGGKPVGHSVDNLGRRCIRYTLDRDTWAHLSAASLAASAH